jgi:hypothetical protein
MVVFYYLCYVLYAVATDPGTIAEVQGFGFSFENPRFYKEGCRRSRLEV